MGYIYRVQNDIIGRLEVGTEVRKVFQLFIYLQSVTRKPEWSTEGTIEGDISLFKIHLAKCLTQLTLILSERAGVTHVAVFAAWALRMRLGSAESCRVLRVLWSVILGPAFPTKRSTSCYDLRESPVQQLWKTGSLSWNVAEGSGGELELLSEQTILFILNYVIRLHQVSQEGEKIYQCSTRKEVILIVPADMKLLTPGELLPGKWPSHFFFFLPCRCINWHAS